MVVERANAWLESEPQLEVVSCEVVEIQGSHSLDSGEGDEDEDEEAGSHTYIAFLSAFRWVSEDGGRRRTSLL